MFLPPFEAYTAAGGITNVGGTVTGDVGTNFGIISGTGEYAGDDYTAEDATDQSRFDLLRLYIHLNDKFVDYPGTHAAAFANETLTPGVYSIGSAGSIGGAVVLEGGPSDFFIIKMNGAMTVGAGASVSLTGGVEAANVFWLINGAISVAAGADLKGTLFSKAGAVGLGANATLEGRMLSMGGAITLADGAEAGLPSGTLSIPVFCEADCTPSAAVDVLGVLSDFSLFASAGNVANTGISGINGTVGTNAGAVTGYAAGIHIGVEEIASDLTGQAAIDLDAAYEALMLLPATATHPATFLNETVTAGVYDIPVAGALGGTVILDAEGDSDAIFVFRFAGAFNIAAASKMILANGARRCNTFWIGGAGVVTGAVNIGASCEIKGNFIAHGGACNSGSGVFMAGRQFSTVGAVNANNAVIYTNPECVTSTPLGDPDPELDTDGDGIPDSTDTDDDGDGINDSDEALIGTDPLLFDTDGDGNSDGVDDFDEDGISNDDESDENAEIVTDVDGLPGDDIVTPLDTDGDGIPDSTDTDDDGDGINDSDEALIGTDPLLFDTDGDGNSDGVDDFDEDGISNDDESDEDAAIETDVDGLPGNDIVTGLETDTDGDGTPDSTDNDDDGDGINDSDEALIGTDPLLFDTDGDGNSDGVDDFDGDGISNDDESDETSPIVTDVDGLPGNDIVTALALDTDGDGTPDTYDSDDDGDGISDSDEGESGTDPLVPNPADTDTDEDGLTDADESDETSSTITDTNDNDISDVVEALDTDGDGVPDTTDNDDDDDGISDSDEAATGTDPLVADAPTPDTDGDGLTDAEESDETSPAITDTNDNGISDAVEALDTDGDGIPDFTDTDDDGDGISDSDEGATGTDPLVADPADTDTDEDGITDADESDENSPEITDIDDNGVSDADEAAAVDLPDFTPTLDIDALGFLNTELTKDFVVNVSEINGASSDGQVVVKMSKGSAFVITYGEGTSTSDVGGGVFVNNNDWEITEDELFITMTLKAEAVIDADSFSSIGFTINRAEDVANQSSQPLTVTIVNGTGSDSQDYNNTYNTVVLAQ